jgi:hypothetical protein
MDDSSTSVSDSKKPHLPSAQITGSMLLGEHIIVLLSPFFFLCLISLVVQMVLLWSFSKVRRKMIVRPLSLVSE